MREFGAGRVTYPVILIRRGTELGVLVSTGELQTCRELSDLIPLVQERLRNL